MAVDVQRKQKLEPKKHLRCFSTDCKPVKLVREVWTPYFICFAGFCKSVKGYCGPIEVSLRAHTYFNLQIFTPIYALFQLLTVGSLAACHKICNSELQVSSDRHVVLFQQNPIACRKFVFKIFTTAQASGIIIFCTTVAILTLMVSIELFFWFDNTGQFSIALVILSLCGKIVQLVLYFMGIKFRNIVLLLSAFFTCILSLLCGITSLVVFRFGTQNNKPFFAENDYYYQNDVTIDCGHGLIFLIAVFGEGWQLRMFWLGYKRFKSINPLPTKVHENLNRIPRSSLKLLEVIGTGKFGKVHHAYIDGLNNSVAAKLLKENASPEMNYWFLEEVLLLTRVEHKNIIKVIGICMDARPMILCMEYMEGGSLLALLRLEDGRRSLSQFQLMSMCLDVANAVEYLAQHGFIHRDVAARNCLLQQPFQKRNAFVVKLADFGLARDVQSAKDQNYNMTNSVFPVHSTAPEGFSGNFSTKSDVWSVGVLIYQVFTWGSYLFGKCFDPTDKHVCPLTETRSELIHQIVVEAKKTLLDLAEPCCSSLNGEIKNLIGQCFMFAPENRPGSEKIVTIMANLIPKLTSVECFPWDSFNQLEEIILEENNTVNVIKPSVQYNTIVKLEPMYSYNH